MNPPARPETAGRSGPLAMVAAMGCWAGNDALVKLCAHDLSVAQILAVRGSFAVALSLALIMLARERLLDSVMLRPAVALRCVLELAAAASATWALGLAPLGVVAALTMAAPLLTLLTALLLGWTPWQWLRLLTVAIGLAGAWLVVQPWRSEPPAPLGVVAALACAICLAARDLSTRRLSPTVSPRQLTLLVNATVWVAGLALWGFTTPERPVQLQHAAWLAAAALGATTGNLLLVKALRSPDLGRVMPLRFTLLLWSSLLGMLVWHEQPSAATWAGLALIAAAGVAALRRPPDSA